MAQDSLTDIDPVESEEWLEAIISVIENEGVERAQYLLQRLSTKVTETGAQLPYAINTPTGTLSPSAKKLACPVIFSWSVPFAR
jgi:pyruvate dehydrogenase E1 component